MINQNQNQFQCGFGRGLNVPVILKGMTGFLLVSKIRNKNTCILIGYVILMLYAVSFLIIPTYGLEVSSGNYSVGIIRLLQGGGPLSSANNNADWTVIGEGIGSLEESLSTKFRLLTGQLYLILGRYGEMRWVISDLQARTEILGPLIPEATWQRDNDPYFYWQIDIEPPDLIGGFSISLDTPPDSVVDITDTRYQFLEDSITSGKHTFFVLPFTSGKVWEETSLLSFEIWVDVDPPLVNSIQPTAGLLTSDNRIPISCYLYDAHSGLDKVATTLTLNNQTVFFDYDAEKQTLIYKPTASLPEGKNTVLLKAVDAVGNSVVMGWEFIVDTQAPLGEILINGGQEITYSSYVSINIEVKDAVSGIKNIYISNDGIFDTELTKPYPYSPVISNWLLNEPDVNGLKTVYVKFQDYAGNLSQTYKDQITLELRTPNTRIISGPPTTTEETEATFIYEASRDGCLFSYKLDNVDWSEWQTTNKAHFTGLTPSNHYFYVKSGFDLNGDGKITIDEEDATPAQWVWTIRPEGALERLRERILFWRR